MDYVRPTEAQIRAALARYAPQLADAPIESLPDGWDSWALQVGDYVLRFPKDEMTWNKEEERSSLEKLKTEQSLQRLLAPLLPLPISQTELLVEQGPNEAPFTLHRYIPGVPLAALRRQPADNFGTILGSLLRRLHSVSSKEGVAEGVRLIDGPAERKARTRLYEQVIKQVFPLISCEARSYTEQRFENNLRDQANYEFEPCLVHGDLYPNLLFDPNSGEPSGLIDFGEARIGNRAADLWLPLIGFQQLGIAGQLTAFLAAYNYPDLDLALIQTEVEMMDLQFPFYGILYGLRTGDEAEIEDGIKTLNASLPRDLRC